MNEVAELAKPGWQAELDLKIGVRPHFGDGVSRLVARRHRGPLVIQRPFYPEGDPCHLYVVHPPGGVVGGDELRIGVEVERGAHAVITTPAATKFYRCDGRTSSQTQELHAAGATLEWLPQESIFYRGADTRTATRVHLDAESRFIGWEIACLGLPARGERFDVGALRLDLEIWKDVKGVRSASPLTDLTPLTPAASAPVFIDRLRLTGSSPARGARWGLSGQDAVGTLLATPTSRGQLEEVRELVADLPLAAVSLVDGILVLRALAPQAEALRNLFVEAWKRLRPGVIGRVAVPPRIWST
ncbi:MAG: urease accessory protein UreD [Steroidobacteraceae bacterium]|nr:urease accessory protein UreD [Steroidobacteraceae bacterium]